MIKKNKKFTKLTFSIFIIFLSFFFIGIYCFSIVNCARDLFFDIANNKTENFDRNFTAWQRQTKLIKPFRKLNKYFPELVGIGKQKIYYVLLQNNWELRPSGGFIGSYAKLKFTDGGLSHIEVQDIYTPDGQLKGHVEPPWPIQTASKVGWWKLRDSNWEPDFPLAAEQINWFFEKGGEEKNNGLIAVNLLFIKDLLKITGPIDLSDFNQQITEENFILITQKQVEKDFFPGSTQKRDFLSTFTNQLILKLKSFNFKQTLQLIKAINKNLDEKQILLNFNNPALQEYFGLENWTGALKRKYQDTKKQSTDYVYIVDTNLGANKANGYVKRSVEHKIYLNNNGLKDELKINYVNDSYQERPNLEDFWGGLYENFLRVFIPIEAENIKIKINGQNLQNRIEIKEYKDKKIKSVGFFVEVQPLSGAEVTINYEKKLKQNPNGLKYVLEIQKQPGIEFYLHNININAEEIASENMTPKGIAPKEIIKKENIYNDKIIRLKLP